MSTTSDHLRNALGLGLGIVTRVWTIDFKDWVTSVLAADINNDGEAEVVACSREGRLLSLMAEKGERKWERVVGEKNWTGTSAAYGLRSEREAEHPQPAIIVGTRDGQVYCYDKDGWTVSKDLRRLPFDKEGWALNKRAEGEASWYKINGVIRQICVNPEQTMIIVGSEDRCVHALDYQTGEFRWKYETGRWVRTVYAYDIDGDGASEVLVGSVDKYIYLLNAKGQLLARYDIRFPVHNIMAADIDRDGIVEILVGTDGKDLTALTYQEEYGFRVKWQRPMLYRILNLCVADLDGDGNLEIIVGSEDKHIYFFDAFGNIIWRHQQKYRALSIFPYDIDRDGIPELIVGSDDNTIRAMRVRLRRGVDKEIRRIYRHAVKSDPSSLEGLNVDERNLLLDVVSKDQIEHVTLKQAQELMGTGDYLQALTVLLRLERQHAQPRWLKEKVGHIRSISFRHIVGKTRREIIVGTSNGDVLAFLPSGNHQWSTHLDDRIVDVQTGFIEHNPKEEIVICSSDHLVYILRGTKDRDRLTAHIESRLSSICIAAPHKHIPAEIIIGSEEKKLYIYGSDLKTPLTTIDTVTGIQVVRTHSARHDHQPEIIAGCLDNQVYSYTRYGELLWIYPTHDHIRAICLKDINSDGNIETIIASEDRNLHVLDSAGHLLWRYFLPDRVLSVDAADTDLDGKVEIFAGCADGFLYVFNRDGEFLWKYQAYDRIYAVRIEDIDDDGIVEIALGSEDELELLQVVNQASIRSLIDACWSALILQQSNEQLISKLLRSTSTLLQCFALEMFAARDSFSASDFDLLEKLIEDGDSEVRQALVKVILEHYPLVPERAQKILQKLAVDQDQEVRRTFVEHIPILMKHDWDGGLFYLKHFLEGSNNRYVRRLSVRILHQVIDTSTEIVVDRQLKIFNLLLAAALDKGSEWVRREAARTLAHFLDRYHGRLIVNVQMLITKRVEIKVLQHIAHMATMPVVKRYISSIIAALPDPYNQQTGVNNENALSLTQQYLAAIDEAMGLVYTKDLRLIYGELFRLLTIDNIMDLAQYQCSLSSKQFQADNEYARNMLDLFNELTTICRALRIYSRREGLPDRLAGLLDAEAAIDKMVEYIEQVYSRPLKGIPMTALPDRQAFLILMERWRKMVLAKLHELRGKAEFKTDLQGNQARLEERVGAWLVAENIGRGTANNVKITLLHNDDFPVVGKKTIEIDAVLPHDLVNAEFIVEPKVRILNLRFAIAYDDAERAEKEEIVEHRMELNESQKVFCFIPNPYSTGAPTHDSKMFFGREADMTYLRDNLAREAKTVMVLYGQRRTGKTTLLFQLLNSGILGEHVPVLIDMQGLALNINIRNFLYKIAYAITLAIKKKDLPVCEPAQDDFEEEPTHAFDVFLDHAEEQLGQRKLILMVDEFEVLEEQVFKGKMEPEIFPYIRNMLQHRQNINFLFAGTHKITEHTKWYRSIFFNIARHYRLTRLLRPGAEALIKVPVADFLEYDPQTVEKICLLTNNQPYLIHLLCRAIVDYCNDHRKTYVTINDVNQVLREVMQTINFHFDWLWDQVSPEERVALSALAEGSKEEGRWLALDEIIELYQHAHIQFKREYLLNSLRSLIDADIIEMESNDVSETLQDSSRFRIPVGLTRRWLRRDKPFDFTRSVEMIG